MRLVSAALILTTDDWDCENGKNGGHVTEKTRMSFNKGMNGSTGGGFVNGVSNMKSYEDAVCGDGS